MAVAVKPAGSLSLTATVPAVGPGRRLLATIVYEPVPPCWKFPKWLSVMVRSGDRGAPAATIVIVQEEFLPSTPLEFLTLTAKLNDPGVIRSEEHTSELQSHSFISY